MELVNILCTASGPGNAALANSWQQQFGLQMPVWGDTTDYMYEYFTGPLGGGSYPSTMVIDLDTMTLRAFVVGGVSEAMQPIGQILGEPHPCAERL